MSGLRWSTHIRRDNPEEAPAAAGVATRREGFLEEAVEKGEQLGCLISLRLLGCGNLGSCFNFSRLSVVICKSHETSGDSQLEES